MQQVPVRRLSSLRTPRHSAGGSSPGGFASATVDWANFNPATSGPCPHSAGVKETAPNTTKIVPQRRSVNICALEIHPTVLGWTGQS